MAVIGITFDTKTKAMACTLDGQAVANVVGAYLGRRYDSDTKYACELVTASADDEADLTTMTRMVASALADPGWPDAAVAGFKAEPKADPVSPPAVDEKALAAELDAHFQHRFPKKA